LSIVKTIHDLYPDQFAFSKENSQGISFFDQLIGNGWVRQAIEDGMSVDEMKQKWEKDVEAFMKIRKQYLLY
jgi:uncharacterized protein YbbC (DUF1343 family)